jgi:putative Ca2+/H+ antiporter (TMEM165/GDT1 family)
VLSALTVLSVMAVYLGKYIGLKMNKRVISKIAGAVFIAMGILCFF